VSITLGAFALGCSASGSHELFDTSSGEGDRPNGGGAGGSSGVIGFGGDASIADSAISADAACATTTAKASKQPVYMLIVLDGSGSMRNENKWAAVVPALDTFFDDPSLRADKAFGVGLTIFSDQNDQDRGGYFGMQVPIAQVDDAQAAALHERLDHTAPWDGTPTEAVLSGQLPALDAYVPNGSLAPNGKRVLVLMTDGVPNDGAPEQRDCIKLTQNESAKTPPTTLFAVGIGDYAPLDTTEYDPAFMGALAVAGGAPNAGCDPTTVTDASKMCHFQITPGGKTAAQIETEFLAAIDKIRALASCTFALAKPGGNATIDPAKVNVIYDDGTGGSTLVPRNANDGWSYDDPTNPTAVTLHGQSCAAMKGSTKGSISIVMGCKTRIN
jgi:hypothetical protein